MNLRKTYVYRSVHVVRYLPRFPAAVQNGVRSFDIIAKIKSPARIPAAVRIAAYCYDCHFLRYLRAYYKRLGHVGRRAYAEHIQRIVALSLLLVL